MTKLEELEKEYKKQKKILDKIEQEIRKESNKSFENFLSISFGNDFHKFEKYALNNDYLCDFDIHALWAFYNEYPVDDSITSMEELADLFESRYIGKYDTSVDFMQSILIDDFGENIKRIFACINYDRLAEYYIHPERYRFIKGYVFYYE